MGGGFGGGGGLGGDLGGGLGGDMDLDGTPDGMEGGSATGSTDMASAPAADSGQPLMEYANRLARIAAGKTVVERYLDMLAERQKERDDDPGDGARAILDESESEARDLDFLLERVENLIGEKDDIMRDLSGEDEPVSAETISDEDLLDDEE
jgi:hypothetical protein